MTPQLKPLDQQVLVITGASSGIGLATAVAAASAGAKLVLAARSAGVLAELADEIVRLGGEAIAVPCDVGVVTEVDALGRAALARFGRIDTWASIAGVSVYGRIDEVPLADAEQVMRTNYWGIVHGARVALPLLRANAGGGALIHVGSEVSEAAVPLQGYYVASKHAVRGFTEALRIELAADGAPVSLTLVEPTAVDTPFPENAGNATALEPKLPTPMIAPERVADAILDAAVNPRRVARIGDSAVVSTTLAKLLPPLASWMGRQQLGRQQRDEPARTREGSLYEPGERGRIHGRGDDAAAVPSEAAELNRRPQEGAR